jgi:cytochrome P450
MSQSEHHSTPGVGPAPLKLDCNEETFAAIAPLAEAWGDIVRVLCPERKHPQYLISNPRDIKQVLVSNHRNYVKGVGFERVEMLLGNGIIVSNGSFWRRQRTMIQPAFSRSNIARFFLGIRAATEALAQRWERLAGQPEPIDITTEISRYALEVILRALFSEDLPQLAGSDDNLPFAFLVEDPTRNLQVAMKFRQLLKQVHPLIAERRQSGRRPFDLLSMMMDARDSKTGAQMSDRELVDEVATMIIAGHETSAGTLNWAWYLLALNPECEALLSAESARVVGSGELQYEQLEQLSYTQQVLEETLRLYPPVWLYTRRALEADTLAGVAIQPGDHIFLSPYLTQHMARYWPQPERFDPQRFAPDGPAQSQPYAFFPFSAGARRCIGEYFSFIEMRTHLAMLCTRFKLELVPGQEVELEPAINLRIRHSLMVTLERKQA